MILMETLSSETSHLSHGIHVYCLPAPQMKSKYAFKGKNGEKEWSTKTWYNIDKPWKHAKGKKPVTQDHMLYDCLYMKRQFHRYRK